MVRSGTFLFFVELHREIGVAEVELLVDVGELAACVLEQELADDDESAREEV